MAAADELVIDSRFRGPPESGNGGYVCGLLARRIEGDALVRLMRPPPLGRPLAVRERAGEVLLLDGEVAVARARPTRLALEAPEPPSAAEAREAARHFRGFHEHVFPGCFVCGPERAEGDGLRIFAGPLPGRDLVAATWLPDASLGTPRVDPAFVWAALDCPGIFSFPQPEGRALVLGELAGRVTGAVRAGEEYVVVGWSLGHEGRKHRTGTALFDAEGRCAGLALGTWLEIPLPGVRVSRWAASGSSAASTR